MLVFVSGIYKVSESQLFSERLGCIHHALNYLQLELFGRLSIKKFSDVEIVFLCDLCQRVGRRPDRWAELQASGRAKDFGYTESNFEVIYDYFSQFVRHWGYILKNMSEDLRLHAFLYPGGEVLDNLVNIKYQISNLAMIP
ncbi:MAG: hypothetical protein VX137_04705 [Pseudomonadota bacterium]|nr:hypothetical protein [Pseudomonadota bacterium]